MCGRFSLTLSPDALEAAFGVDFGALPRLRPRFNVAPTDEVVIVRPGEAALARWGLAVGAVGAGGAAGARRGCGPLINVRQETLFDRPGFAAARRRRCLVPADGFYEWRGQGAKKQAFRLRVRDAAVFAMAGISAPAQQGRAPKERGPTSSARSSGDLAVETVAILTTAPNDLVAPIHDRMPVILRPEDWARWLDPSVEGPDALRPLLVPFDPARMVADPVSSWVNDVAHDDPRCLEVVADGDPPSSVEGGPGRQARRGKRATHHRPEQLAFDLGAPPDEDG